MHKNLTLFTKGKSMDVSTSARKDVYPVKPFYEDTGDRFAYKGDEQIGFGGVDYGHCVMASMVPVTTDQVQRAVANYNHPDHQVHDHPPQPLNTTSESINYLTGTIKFRAKLNKNKNVRIES